MIETISISYVNIYQVTFGRIQSSMNAI